MIRFTKNVSFDTESWDFGLKSGLRVSVGTGDGQLRHAVQFNEFVVVRPAVYAEPRKIYVTSLSELPVLSDDDPEDDSDDVVLRRDAGGYYYTERAAVIDPGETRTLTRAEKEAQLLGAHRALNRYLENIYQAGQLLAAGRIEEPE